MNDIENDAIRQVAESALHGQEHLLWVGRPNPLRVAARYWLQSVLGVVWTAFVVFMISQVNSMGSGSGLARPAGSNILLFFQLFMVAFLLLGISMILSPAWHYLKATRRVYALTGQRALIIERLPIQVVHSYFARDISHIERKGNDQQGDIIFARETRTYKTRSGRTRRYVASIGFLGVENPRQVEALMLKVFADTDGE